VRRAGGIHDLPTDDWRRIIDVKLFVFLLSHQPSYATGQAINVTGGEVVW
jgi:hypothetical protein